MLEQQSQLSTTQTQLGTGKRVVVPSDDPAAAVQILDLQKSLDITGRYQDNIGAARSSLDMEDKALQNGIDLVQRVRELMVQANSGVLSDQQRQGIAAEVSEHLASMLNIANSQDSNADYLFAGFTAAAKPFSQSTAGFSYAGDQGQRLLQIGPQRQIAISDSGSEVFQAIRNGNGTFVTSYNAANTGTGVVDPGNVVDASAWVSDTYTINFLTPTTYEVRNSAAALVTSGNYQADATIAFNGIQTAISGTPAAGDRFTIAPSTNQDVFTTLKNTIDALNQGTGTPVTKAQATNNLNQSMVALDRVLDKFTTLQAGVGARLNALDNAETANSEFVSNTQTALSGVQDLDYPEAISRFNRQLQALQAAQQTFTKVQNLSLFNYINN